MFIRALFAFLALPGIVAFAVPIAWLVTTARTALAQPLGLLPLLAGCVGLLTAGLYRYSRNPMYVSVLLIVLGWAVSFNVPGLYWYAIGVGVAFHLRVVFGEEPWLAQTHGADWSDYTRRVRRWL